MNAICQVSERMNLNLCLSSCLTCAKLLKHLSAPNFAFYFLEFLRINVTLNREALELCCTAEAAQKAVSGGP